MPSTPFIGVLISWLSMARSAALAALARAASSFASASVSTSSANLTA